MALAVNRKPLSGCGSTGVDQLFGEGGADRFVFSPGDGLEFIKDFRQSDGDVIDVRGFGISTFFELELRASLSSTAQFGGDAKIDFGGADVLTIEHVELSGLSGWDFVFI